jgi:hypothetical protein
MLKAGAAEAIIAISALAGAERSGAPGIIIARLRPTGLFFIRHVQAV